MPLEDLILMLAVLGGGAWVLRPLLLAVADRIRHRGNMPGTEHLATLREELLGELQQVRQELTEIGERVDFAERLLAKQKDAGQLAPPR
ncbi:MAG: hypothetical protein ACREMV_12215 [Gemmatimonadales bacterium]